MAIVRIHKDLYNSPLFKEDLFRLINNYCDSFELIMADNSTDIRFSAQGLDLPKDDTEVMFTFNTLKNGKIAIIDIE